MPRRLRDLAALTDSLRLAALLGPVREWSVTPMPGVGYSAASHARIDAELASGGRRSLVVKRCDLAADWTARRTGDADGREAALLAEPALRGVWDAFECPYLAYATEPGRVGLLMEDLSADLFPDERRPVRAEHEQALIASLAGLHARFWDHAALDRPWLTSVPRYCDLLGPALVEDEGALALFPSALRERLVRGWSAALRLLPAGSRELVTRPGAELAAAWSDLPRTLLHGDVKVANFAVRPSGRVAAFDWAVMGAGPCTIDLGWYLAINATRLAGTKEVLVKRYRALLEDALGRSLPDATWRSLEDLAVVYGSRMLLWSKALALEGGSTEAKAEWEWWAGRLAHV